MTYRAYIKKDYKPEIRWVPDQPRYLRKFSLMSGLGLAVLLLCGYAFYPQQELLVAGPRIQQVVPLGSDEELQVDDVPIYPSPTSLTKLEDQVSEIEPVVDIPSPWRSVQIKKGDNLSIIFDRLGISPQILYQVMNSGTEARALKDIMPGQKLGILVEEEQLQALKFEIDLVTTLNIEKAGKGYTSNLNIIELEVRTKESSGDINSSLFLAGQRAGLSDNLIMQMVSIFGWDIDFALDIRSGDQFSVIYEEQFKNNVKVGDGPILAAEFINRNQSFRTVRYTSPDADTNYFNQDGVSMRKAFLRSPLNFSRISSRFNLRRKHPVLNRIRAHKGVDYAAPTGTPIKATGDGTVLLAGRKGGYGKAVILKHGGNRSTLYAHMSSFSKNTRRGRKVKQGQIIGYVGKSGLATGPHLHYEFRVNGVHRNPLTVKLPKASGVPKKFLSDFKQQTSTILARLDKTSNTTIAQQKNAETNENNVIALDDTNRSSSVQ